MNRSYDISRVPLLQDIRYKNSHGLPKGEDLELELTIINDEAVITGTKRLRYLLEILKQRIRAYIEF